MERLVINDVPNKQKLRLVHRNLSHFTLKKTSRYISTYEQHGIVHVMGPPVGASLPAATH